MYNNFFFLINWEKKIIKYTVYIKYKQIVPRKIELLILDLIT